MNTLKQIEKRLVNAKSSQENQVLWKLIRALCEHEEFKLSELYELDYENFELALEVLKGWRLNRYTKTKERLKELVDAQQE